MVMMWWCESVTRCCARASHPAVIQTWSRLRLLPRASGRAVSHTHCPTTLTHKGVVMGTSQRGLQTLPTGRFLPVAGAAAASRGNVGGVGLPPRRWLWGWLNTIFNKVDESRIREVGADRACAEWLLRCGAVVRWLDRDQWTKDYNSLPASGGRGLKIEEVDATDSAVMHIGFPHFKGCHHIRRILFHRASYLDDTALSQLQPLSKSLKQLQISSCGNITPEGLRHLHHLKNLEYLLLFDLPEVRDKEAVVRELEAALPSCTVVFPYSQAKDDPSLKDSSNLKDNCDMKDDTSKK